MRVADNQDLACELLGRLKGVNGVESNNSQILIELDGDRHDFNFIAKALLDNNFRVCELREEEVNLETAFMRLTKGIVQ